MIQYSLALYSIHFDSIEFFSIALYKCPVARKRHLGKNFKAAVINKFGHPIRLQMKKDQSSRVQTDGKVNRKF